MTDSELPDLPVYRVVEDHDNEDELDEDGGVKVMGAPYFISVHQLVEVMEYDTAILECAVTNIDSSVTVRDMVSILNISHYHIPYIQQGFLVALV